MRILLFALLLALLPVAGGLEAAPTAQLPAASAASIVRDGERWTVEYRLSRDRPAWLFAHSSVGERSGRPWRPDNWRVLTPGVRIERRGRHDLLVARRGNVPRRIRIEFRPVSVDLVAEYDPALIFSDGSVALWSGQFHLYPLDSAAAGAALPLDLNGVEFESTTTQVSFRDTAAPVLHAGRRLDPADVEGDKIYVLFGPLEPVPGEDIAALIDPELPHWLKAELASATPAMMGELTRMLGAHGGPMPTLLVSWRGPTPELMSMGGSTLPAQIGMTFEGIGVVEENEQVRSSALWFIAHEAAHFWLGNAVGYEYARDAWITEGGADLLAARTVERLSPDRRNLRLQESVNDCASLASRPVASAGERNENRAYYACGAVFALVAEAASRQPFENFVKRLVEANREDGILSRAEWLAELDRLSGDRSLGRDIVRLLDEGADNPKTVLASLFTRSGVAFYAGEDGVPRLR